MSNPRELRAARTKAWAAWMALVATEALPRRIGSRVRWSHGLVWVRVGDDAWAPEHDGVIDTDTYGTYTSEHVATSAGSRRAWEVISADGRVRRTFDPWAR